jgi:alkanesulfonate monooxygenase SsuD/methylene tetrahydromethanopterin reductase-like flavin-dependent oxidoreductase (luciferase family)
MWKELEPHPAQNPIPVWIGSWGSEAGLRRTARLGDGWLASAYNTTPAKFGEDLKKLRTFLRSRDRDAPGFPNGIATTFFHVTDRPAEADEILTFMSGVLKRPASELRDRFLVGPAGESIEKIRAYQGAGAQRILVWPVRDELQQLELFMERVGRNV